MEKLLWIVFCLCFTGCTYWPQQGYLTEGVLPTDRTNLQIRFDYLNQHLNIAEYRGANSCVPAHLRHIQLIQSRVQKSILLEDVIHREQALNSYEKHVALLINNLDFLAGQTNCAITELDDSNIAVHPLTYQFDMLLNCETQFVDNSTLITPMYQICLRQAGLLLDKFNDVKISFTQYQFAANDKQHMPNKAESYAIISHQLQPENAKISTNNTEINDLERSYIAHKINQFIQAPETENFQISQSQIKLVKEHQPAIVIEQDQLLRNDTTSDSIDVDIDIQAYKEQVNLYNLRVDEITELLRLGSLSTAKIIINQEQIAERLLVMPERVISTLLWQSARTERTDIQVKNWRFLLDGGALFSDQSLPQGLRL